MKLTPNWTYCNTKTNSQFSYLTTKKKQLSFLSFENRYWSFKPRPETNFWFQNVNVNMPLQFYTW